jgi:cytochrome c5
VTSVKLSLSAALAAAITMFAFVTPAQAAEVSGQAVYEVRCKSCHEAGIERTPSRADMPAGRTRTSSAPSPPAS